MPQSIFDWHALHRILEARDPVQWSQKHFGTLPQVENDGSIQVPAVYAELHSRSLAEIFWPMA